MRLLNTETRKLEFFTDSDTPLYAILSHRWGNDEVLFNDVDEDLSYTDKAGYDKLNNACIQAESQGFQYIWIDTCCIDKTSSAELSEAINSMFRWYQESTVCYAYLSDVDDDTVPSHQFNRSNWFSRGWTLQELIAPPVVIFYNSSWSELGTKSDLGSTITNITGIPLAILKGENVDTASVAQRMAWASKRKTTRIEDQAYCLMGLFGINMPMLYGEGELAFIRLQEEILKTSNDHSIFAWTSKYIKTDRSQDVLASSPSFFAQSSKIVPLARNAATTGAPRGPITLDSKGIHLVLSICPGVGTDGKQLAILPCAVENWPKARVGIWLCRAPGEEPEDNCFVKVPNSPLDTNPHGAYSDPDNSDCYDSGAEDGPQDSPVPVKVCSLQTHLCVLRHRRSRTAPAPITKAARQKNARVVELLLQRGADPNEVDEAAYADAVEAFRKRHGTRSWFDHAFDKHMARSQQLTMSASGIFPGKESLLLGAIVRGDMKMVKVLLEWGAQVTVHDRVGRDPLTLAVEAESATMVEWLLVRGADPNTSDLQNWTPLMVAVDIGYLPAVKALLANGANPNATRGARVEKFRVTALDMAQGAGHADIVELLKDRTAPSCLAPGYHVRRYRNSKGWSVEEKDASLEYMRQQGLY